MYFRAFENYFNFFDFIFDILGRTYYNKYCNHYKVELVTNWRKFYEP